MIQSKGMEGGNWTTRYYGTRRSFLFATATFALLAIRPLAAQELNLQNYNVIIFNDLNTSRHVEGRTFVGHNLTNADVPEFGHKLNVPTDDRTLIVGHDILPGNQIKMEKGSLYIGGTTSGRSIAFNGGGSTIPIEITEAEVLAIKDYYVDVSEAMADLPANSTVTLPGDQPAAVNLNAVADSEGLAVFYVSGTSVFTNSKAQQINLNGTGVKDIVINVSGESILWNSANMVGSFDSDYWQGHVVWNFYEATSVTISQGLNFKGAILAPNASVNLGTGNLDGAIVANNVTTGGEIHLPGSLGSDAYSGYIPVVPEPGTSALLIIGAIPTILAFTRRRKRGAGN